MISKEMNQAIYDKYVAPTKKDRKKYIGIEIEMPIVNLNDEAVEEDLCQKVVSLFKEQFGFEVAGIDDNNRIYSMTEETTGDNLSFDCSYSNLELSLGKGENLFEIKSRFEAYYTFLQEEFQKYNYILTGMGINPHYNINKNKPIQNERYRMLYHHLHTYNQYDDMERKFCNRADFGTFTSASQVQIDVDYDQVIDTINVFGKLEPYKALLFGNSYMEEYPENMVVRNMLWEHSMQGYNSHNIGMFDNELTSIEDLVAYIRTMSIYCVMRDGKYVNFKPIPVEEYMKMDCVKGEFYNNGVYEEIEFVPSMDDLEYLRSFKFEDLTFRGTIEFRSMCCQPICDSMTVAAFHIGLIYNMQSLKDWLQADTVLYSHGYSSSELQKMMSKRELPLFVDQDQLVEALHNILEIAKEGLAKRGYQEEELLAPLYERAKHLSNPAKEMVKGIEQGLSIRHFIYKYAQI